MRLILEVTRTTRLTWTSSKMGWQVWDSIRKERPVVYELEYLKPVVAGDTLERCVWETRSGPAMIARVADGTPVVRGYRHSAVTPELA